MSRFIPAAERIRQARALIQKARDLPAPATGGWDEFSYIAQVKAFLQDARDLVKFIPKTPSATVEMKAEVSKISQEADQANQEILHKDMKREGERKEKQHGFGQKEVVRLLFMSLSTSLANTSRIVFLQPRGGCDPRLPRPR